MTPKVDVFVDDVLLLIYNLLLLAASILPDHERGSGNGDMSLRLSPPSSTPDSPTDGMEEEE